MTFRELGRYFGLHRQALRWLAWAPLVGAMLAVLIASPARAEQAAADVVRQYQAALLATMKQGAGYDARAAALDKPIAQAFDLAFIAQRAAGPAWAGFSAADKARYVAAFRRYSVAQHASRFKKFGGESFELLGTDDVGRGYFQVRTNIVTGGGERVSLNYLMGKRDGGWKIVDVFAKGISEVATRRSDFATVIRDRGAEGLVRELDAKVAEARAAP